MCFVFIYIEYSLSSEQMKICHRLVNLDIRYGKRKALGKAIDA